jgi:alkylhydroperoxidase family enzyme
VDRRQEIRRALEASVLDGEAHTPPSLRRAVAGRQGEVPAELRALVAKIHDHAYRVTDEDLAALAAQFSDDERFEIVVAASVGAAFARLDRALALFGDA